MITVRNVNEALSVILTFFSHESYYRNVAPRGLRTLELKQMPFVTRYTNPQECVLYDATRNANPFFHFFEALWVLAGRDDVKFMTHLLPRFKDYSDDGMTFHGAYGARLLEHDQIFEAIKQLKKDKHTRRAVVSIWQPGKDSGYTGKDMPCNCMLDFKIRDDQLDMIVSNRSNDAIWGAYGSNAVQFAFLHQWVSYHAGVSAGSYIQVSNSMHVYPDNEPTKTLLRSPISYFDPYKDCIVAPMRWIDGLDTIEDWDEDLARFFLNFDTDRLGTSMEYETSWWANTAYPMWMAFHRYRDNAMEDAASYADMIHSTDWRLVVSQWFDRIVARRTDKGVRQ
jgi:hypothetical protein